AAIALNSEVPNMVVPTVGVSLSTIITSIRGLLGMKWHRTISGEFLEKNQRLWLRLRMDGSSFYVSDSGVDVDNPDALLLKAASKIFNEIQPYISAAAEDDPKKSLELAKQAIAHLPESNANVVWCYILAGDLYAQRGQFSQAKEALTKASEL